MYSNFILSDSFVLFGKIPLKCQLFGKNVLRDWAHKSPTSGFFIAQIKKILTFGGSM